MSELHDAFRKAVSTKVRDREVFIASGKAPTFEEYRRLCGQVSGLKEALEIFNDVAKRHGEIEGDE